MSLEDTYNLLYTSTNEYLDAILEGLDINSKDRVLAVAGSGDQALAMLEMASFVKAVDSTKSQVNFFKKRIEALQERDYLVALGTEVKATDFSLIPLQDLSTDGFSVLNLRNRFFLSEGRLDRIRNKLGNLVVEHTEDILDLAQKEKGFSKIYLSNVFLYSNKSGSQSNIEITSIFRGIADNLPSGGLIYVANHKEIRDYHVVHSRGFSLPSINPSQFAIKKLNVPYYEKVEESYFLPSNLKVDLDLTKKARKANEGLWSPAVYRKV
jgi:hypothetical protein